MACIGFETMTIDGTADNLSSAAGLTKPVVAALCVPEDDGYPFHYTLDGATTATNAVGIPNSGYKDDYFVLLNLSPGGRGRSEITNFQAIRDGSNSATLQVHYYDDIKDVAGLI